MFKENLLERAFELSLRGRGFVGANPLVGCVIVGAGGEILAEGWHEKYGHEHAEINALKNLAEGANLAGAAMYVTLEPCCFEGKTPACTEAILASGIKNIFIGVRDPNPQVNGLGMKRLRDAGLQVSELMTGNLKQKINNSIAYFRKVITTGLPYVIWKAAISLDGKIEDNSGGSHWITEEVAREDARMERSFCDAVVVGSGTVKADDCVLRCSLEKDFWRVVIDKDLKLSPLAKIFSEKKALVATSELARNNLWRFVGKKVEFFGAERVEIRALLEYLAKLGVGQVFVEGGSGVFGSFYDAFLAGVPCLDEVLLYQAPFFVGGEAKGMIGGIGLEKLLKAKRMRLLAHEKCGDGLKIRLNI